MGKRQWMDNKVFIRNLTLDSPRLNHRREAATGVVVVVVVVRYQAL